MQDLEDSDLLAERAYQRGAGMPTESGHAAVRRGMMQREANPAEERAAIEAARGACGAGGGGAGAYHGGDVGTRSACAGLVMLPKAEHGGRQFGFVPLSQDARGGVVGEDGSVENRVVELPGGTDRRQLQQAAN